MSSQLVMFSEGGNGEPRPGLLVDEEVHDISHAYPSVRAFLGAHPRGWDADLAPPGGGRSFSRGAVRLGPPLDDRSLVYCVGANYRQHAEEAGLSVPKQPIVFMKPYTSLVGPDEPILLSPVSDKMDYEGELGVVISRDATRVSKREAPAYVAGLTIVNDVTARDLQWVELGGNRIVDWFASKALDRSSPVGPAVASVSQVRDIHSLALRTFLNGEVMQDADTSLMVASAWELIEFITARATLRAGDVVATGTPFGVGGFREIFLKDGDRVRIELEGAGVLENAVRGAG